MAIRNGSNRHQARRIRRPAAVSAFFQTHNRDEPGPRPAFAMIQP